MPLCFICKNNFYTVRKLLFHFNFFHSNYKFEKYSCIDENCNRTFTLRNSFCKHLKKHTSQNTTLTNEPSPSIQSNIIFQPDSETALNIDRNNSSNTHSPVIPLIASLYANPLIPRNAVQAVVVGIDKFLKEGLTSGIKKLCDEKVNGNLSQETLNLLTEIQTAIQSPLDGLLTEHNRLQYFKAKGTYIPPKEIVIGQRLSDVRKQGVHSMDPCVCTEQMVPLRLLLKSFLSLENVLSEILHYKKYLEENSSNCKNYIQGSFWKSKNKGENVLPLFLFFDDFESGNVLGSHSGLHKLGAVYVSLACMPPHRLSSLSNLFLVLLFHSLDRLNFGNNAVFSPLIEELNYLKNTGIYIETPDFKGVMYFELALLLGDNLGLHSITGFTESFSSNYPCRICKVRKENLKDMCYEERSIFRNSVDYEKDLELDNVSQTGIKESCVWLNVDDFSLFNHVGVDLMHDFFEGCVKYVMAFLLSCYINDLRMFSLTVLNDRMFGFDYGPDNSSKPVAISADHLNSGNIRLSASESWVFCRYFGLLVGDFVPIDEPSWDLYIMLRKVMDLLVSPSIDKERLALLRTLIAEFNELYLKFSKEPLKPKFHFLLHYPTVMEKFGPVIHFWSMRYEAKHRVSKLYARASFNRRNICKSLAIKHQLQLNKLFITGKLGDVIQTGPEIDLNLVLHEEICSYLCIDFELPLVEVSWATVNGTTYKKGSIVTGDLSDEGTCIEFFLVQKVFLYNLKSIVFMYKKFKTIGFDEHFYAYEVVCPSIESDTFYMFQNMLVSYAPNNLTYAPNGLKYITLRS